MWRTRQTSRRSRTGQALPDRPTPSPRLDRRAVHRLDGGGWSGRRRRGPGDRGIGRWRPSTRRVPTAARTGAKPKPRVPATRHIPPRSSPNSSTASCSRSRRPSWPRTPRRVTPGGWTGPAPPGHRGIRQPGERGGRRHRHSLREHHRRCLPRGGLPHGLLPGDRRAPGVDNRSRWPGSAKPPPRLIAPDQHHPVPVVPIPDPHHRSGLAPRPLSVEAGGSHR